MTKIGVILAGGGVGRRFGGETYKQFVELEGRPVYAWSMAPFLELPEVVQVVAVVPEGLEPRLLEMAARWFPEMGPELTVVAGGRSRQESVAHGLEALTPEAEWVAVHDAARPLVTREMVEETLFMAQEVGAAAPAIPVADTVKEVDDSSLVIRTLDRSRLRLVQTPQVCRRSLLEEAMAAAREQELEATDEAGLLEAVGAAVAIVEGSRFNLKITHPDDLLLAQALLRCRRDGA